MKAYTFQITVYGYGNSVREGWESALSVLEDDLASDSLMPTKNADGDFDYTQREVGSEVMEVGREAYARVFGLEL